jgi:hypothetical protein
MNDLEHDLRELFEQRASDVDVPGLAPTTVLRRGRRRQVGTIATGVAACLVAVGVAAAAIGQARHPAIVPGGNGLPARSTSIGGVPVTAPAGWTLVDDYPLGSVFATTSQTCTFTATGAPVGGGATPIAESGGDGGTAPSQSCSSSTQTSATGIPVLQLSNFEIPLGESVCGRGNFQNQTSLPADGVAVYVADMEGDPNINQLQAACPGSADGPVTTFLDQGHHSIYAAIGVVGPDASDADIAVARDYVSGLSHIEIVPNAPQSGPGPGYVMAAGSDGNTSWRLEAGLTSTGTDGGNPGLGAIMVTTDGAGTQARTVDLPTQQHIAEDAIDLGDGGVVQFGTATVDVTAVNIDLPSGGTVAATTFAWPSQIASAGLPSGDGWIWFAQTPERGDVRPELPSAPTTPSGPTAASPAGRLQSKTDDQGRYTILGNDFGHDWSFHREPDGTFVFYLDGVEQRGERLTPGAETYLDIPGGTLVLALEQPSVSQLYVTSDVEGKDVVANGAWAPSSLAGETNDRVWVEALPGSGAGYEWAGSTLPLAIDWPTNSTITPGDQIAAGSTPAVSWVEVWSDHGCPTFQVVAAVNEGDLGSSPCPVPWNPQQYANRTSYIGGVYGQSHATVWMLGPSGLQADATSSQDPSIGGSCGGSIADVGRWAQTGGCVFVIPVGQTYVIHPTLEDGTPLRETVTITAHPGRIDFSQTGSAPQGGGSPTPTP